jgi:NhaP-type Na+/H+ or K+/H+ antiporter
VILHEELLISLALVITLSVGAQWIAWRVSLPSILVLLAIGIIAGPITHALDTDELLGELLFPVVSLSVAIILFEGGLSLRLNDLREIGAVVWNLITIGVAITWVVGAVAARILLDLDWSLSLLIGSVLVVTGPTVVLPLLNQIRPSARVSSILRWEGIVIDPVGAVLAILVFEEILNGEGHVLLVAWGLIKTVLIGGVFGFVGAQFLLSAFIRLRVPDSLQISTVLMTVIATFTISNVLQAESGLLTVTVLGVNLANQTRFDIRHIVEFKENLQVLLISSLFILLGARLDFDTFSQLGFNVVVFVIVMIVIARPVSVWVSTLRSGLTWREKLFISWMAPRGIVAASVASVFALGLADQDVEHAEVLVPLTFTVIIVTVTLYGLTAGLLAKHLGLLEEKAQGALIIGAHGWARHLASEIQQAGFRVIMTDTNYHHVRRAQASGLEVFHTNILNEAVIQEIDLSGIGRLLALTPNDEVNSLASIRFKSIFGEEEVFQLPRREGGYEQESISLRYGGKNLFGPNVTYDYISQKLGAGAKIMSARVDEALIQSGNLDLVEPLFVITGEGNLQVQATKSPPNIRRDSLLICLVDIENQAYFANPSDLQTAKSEGVSTAS